MLAVPSDLGVLGDWYEDQGENGELVRNLLLVLPISFGFFYNLYAHWHYEYYTGSGRIGGYTNQYNGCKGNGYTMYSDYFDEGVTFHDKGDNI